MDVIEKLPFFKFELSEAVILAKKSTGIFPLWSLRVFPLYGNINNALYHVISEHSSGSTPSIPGLRLVQIFITE